MSALNLLQALADATYVLVFLLMLWRTGRRPVRANVDTTLLFGDATLIVALSFAEPAVGISQVPAVNALNGWLLLALAYLLLRLVPDFVDVPQWIVAASALGLVAAAVILLLLGTALPTWAVLLLVVYFAATVAYASAMFGREATRTRGVTRRRMQAVAIGSAFLGLVIVADGLTALTTDATGLWMGLATAFGAASGMAYYVGFAPPTWLRRAWQMPEVREFVQRGLSLSRIESVLALMGELEVEIATTLGAPGATVGLYDGVADVLRFPFLASRRGPGSRSRVEPAGDAQTDDWWEVRPAESPLLSQAFLRGEALLATNLSEEPPGYLALYAAFNARSALAVPIHGQEQPLGVLVAYGARTSLFVEEDLDLALLLADQTAVLLESRRLADEAARAEALAETSRAKDELLASISHDLRNPLAAIRGTAQVLRRRLQRDAAIEPDRLDAGLAGIEGAAGQMASMVDQVLDYARLQMARPLELEKRPLDLVEVARRVAAGASNVSERHRIRVEASVATLVGQWDASRVERVIQNLVENARKYSPEGGEVVLRVWREDHWAVLSVADQGIGIPTAEVSQIFERFHRASNARGVIPGTGIGLASGRQILEQHGGRLEAASEEGQGSTFTLRLPLDAPTSDEIPGRMGEGAETEVAATGDESLP